MLKIIGAGLTGCVIASQIPSIVYEKEKEVGGACKDNENYQEFIHVLHTDYEDVWELLGKYTTFRPLKIRAASYVKGDYWPWPPKKRTKRVFDEQIDGYSRKMWRQPTPLQAKSRIGTSQDGYMFHEKYQGIPDYSLLFKNLLEGTKVIIQHVHDEDQLEGQIILTGAIDEYFGYCYGKLPYRGMKSVHYQSEIRLPEDYIYFPDPTIPFQRIVDYDRLGFKGGWVGIEIAGEGEQYPIRNEESIAMYLKYKELADSKGIIVAGRLGTFNYIDSDDAIHQALELVKVLK